jgi:hypothetical protein
MTHGTFLVVSHTVDAPARSDGEVCTAADGGGAVPVSLSDQWDDVQGHVPRLTAASRAFEDIDPSRMGTRPRAGGRHDPARREIVRESPRAVGLNSAMSGFLPRASVTQPRLHTRSPGSSRALRLHRRRAHDRSGMRAQRSAPGGGQRELGRSTRPSGREEPSAQRNRRVVIRGLNRIGVSLSSFGCDGVVIPDAHRSTAYSFLRVDVPIVWAERPEALLTSCRSARTGRSSAWPARASAPRSSLVVEVARANRDDRRSELCGLGRRTFRPASHGARRHRCARSPTCPRSARHLDLR